MKYVSDSELVGQWFDRLYVLDLIFYKGRYQCRCLCECGNISYVRGTKLKNKHTRSCGCLRDERIDLTGEHFDFWEVLKIHSRNKHHTYWLCRCECGTEKPVSATSLQQGVSTNCGCANRYDIEGIKHGRLLPLEKVIKTTQYKDVMKKKAYWRCICDCGNETEVLQYSLLSGTTKSCGCLSSDTTSEAMITHGLTGTREYINWMARHRREKKEALDNGWAVNNEIDLYQVFAECVLCGSSENLTVDHLLPLNLGYGLSIDNAVVLCKSCNSSKGDKYITDLSPEIRQKLINASCLFQDYLYETQS